jgi:hypothetical protein
MRERADTLQSALARAAAQISATVRTLEALWRAYNPQSLRLPPVIVGNSIRLVMKSNWVMLLVDERCLQRGLVGTARIVRSQVSLQAEILTLQLNVLRRGAPILSMPGMSRPCRATAEYGIET